MTRGSRQNLVSSAARVLQSAFARRRAAARLDYEALQAAGAFRAAFEPIFPRQAELGLPMPLAPDPTYAEAA